MFLVLCSIYINALKRHVESFDIDYFGDIEDFSYKSQIKKNTINKIRYLNRYVKIFIANLYAGNKTLAEQYLNYVKGVFNAVLSLSKRNRINTNKKYKIPKPKTQLEFDYCIYSSNKLI